MFDKKTQIIMTDIKKMSYKCQCGHSVIIANKTGKALCQWCGRMVKAEGKTVYDLAIETKLKNRYKKFLEKRRKEKNGN